MRVRREKELEATRAAASAEQQKQELQERADALQLFLDGQPTDLALLDFQLLDPEEVALNPDRRRAAIASVSPAPATPATGPAEPAPPPETLEAAKARLDTLRARLLALPSEEITRLMQVQAGAPDQTSAIAQAEAEAEEAARAAAVATAEAEQSKHRAAAARCPATQWLAACSGCSGGVRSRSLAPRRGQQGHRRSDAALASGSARAQGRVASDSRSRRERRSDLQ